MVNKLLYLLLLPGLLYLFIFNYIPMYGVIIAFKDFHIVKGIIGSPWAGFQNFKDLFQSIHFYRVFRNSLILSFLRLLCGFPIPIILAILLNETRHMGFKRTVQTVIYIPHFISWVVIIGIAINFLSLEGGINHIVQLLGIKRINFLIEERYFRGIVILAEIWKGAGWGTIIYLAAISGIDPQLYEAAIVDGASRLQRIWRITIPGITGTIIVLLILRLGRILNNGFEQIFLLYNDLTLDVADVFETYAYRTGLLEGRFAFSTAVNMFKSVVGLILILSTNTLARRAKATALW
jgi:putative aldouronate transport system permease protein